MVAEYIKSEQAVIDLDKRIGLRARYERPDIDFGPASIPRSSGKVR